MDLDLQNLQKEVPGVCVQLLGHIYGGISLFILGFALWVNFNILISQHWPLLVVNFAFSPVLYFFGSIALKLLKDDGREIVTRAGYVWAAVFLLGLGLFFAAALIFNWPHL